MKLLKVLTILVIALAMFGCFRAIHTVNKAINNGFDTAYQEFKPETLLKKYETFKDMSASLDEKVASIDVLKNQLVALNDQYKGEKRKDWARVDASQYNVLSSTISGEIISYNELASQYNSEMSKFNWRFTNAGDLPQGATKVLPREYKPYINTF